jgi:hypothetical protein
MSENGLTSEKPLFANKATKGTVFEVWDLAEILPLKEMERYLRIQYVTYVRNKSMSDSEAARKLGLAPPNYHRMCKELGLK